MRTRETLDVSKRRPAIHGYTSVRGRGHLVEVERYDGNGTLTRETQTHDDIGTKRLIDANPHLAAKMLSMRGMVDIWARKPTVEDHGSLTEAEARQMTAPWEYMQGVLDIFEETFDGLPADRQEAISSKMAEWEQTPPTRDDFSKGEIEAIKAAQVRDDLETRRPASYFAELAYEQLAPAPQVTEGLGQVAASAAQAA